jgi:hypothetical protein
MMPTSEAEKEVTNNLTKALAGFEQASKAAWDSGLRISDEAQQEINRLLPEPEQRVELALWLMREEHFDFAHNLMGLKPAAQVVEIRKLAKREDVKGSLNNADTEDYIDARRQARREGKRR